MRHALFFTAVAAALAGCRPDFDTLEAACPDSVPGGGTTNDQAVDALLGINCYRRYTGLAQAPVDSRYASASRAHARYVDENGYSVAGYEDPTLPGFTGEEPWDRLEAQGYELPENYLDTNYFWTMELPTAGTIDNEVDVWMSHYLTRQVLLHPGVIDSGYGRSGDVTVFENLSPFPSNDRVERPYVYPKDGQTDVPISSVQSFAGEIIAAGSIIGYPITITVSSAITGQDLGAENPFGLTLLDQRVLDPDNQLVDVYEIQPQTTPSPFPFTVALVPEEPLQPNTTYRVFARVSWADGIKNIETSFTTGSATVDEGIDSLERGGPIHAPVRFGRRVTPAAGDVPSRLPR